MSDPRAFDMLIAIWSLCSAEDREAFVSYLAICGYDSSHTESPSDGDAFAAVKGKARLANVDDVEPSLPGTDPQEPKSPPAADKAETVAPPAVSASPIKTLSKADQIRLLRPHCQHPGTDLCGGSGRNHCHSCKKLMAEGEAG